MPDQSDEEGFSRLSQFTKHLLALWLYDDCPTGDTYGIVRNSICSNNRSGSVGCRSHDFPNPIPRKTSQKG